MSVIVRRKITNVSVSNTRRLIKAKASGLFKENKVYTVDVDTLEPYVPYVPDNYQDGPEGFISWCEDKVSIPIYPVGAVMAQWCPIGELPNEINPKTGKSYDNIWQEQKEICRTALRMIDGEFIHRLIVLCWMRGEGKSLLACLIQLWKFFNWSKQQIVLGANSKEQITFVHFDIIKDIILNSPPLLSVIGKRNILEKKIRLTDDQGNDVSVIRAISSFSGIVSNITGYTFSEIFDMKNPKFFVQLDGSIRNIPNAFGVIDSTVSAKTHILYNLFDTYVHRKDPSLFFSYRFSKEGKSDDYWNPNMSQAQLDAYRSKFPLGDYERYFLNTWSSGSLRVFTEETIEAMGNLGIDGVAGNSAVLMTACDKKVRLEDSMRIFQEQRKGMVQVSASEVNALGMIKKRLMPMENYIPLRDAGGFPMMATLDDLERLGILLDTKWAILAGLDRADPMKITNRGARTVFTCVAKGLPGSGSRPFLLDQGAVPNYLYIVLHVVNVDTHSLSDIKDLIMAVNTEFDGLDKLCGERWGIWDLVPWCEEQNILLEAIFPTYDKQKAAFSELYLTATGARIKCSPLGVWGTKETDLFREEARVFFHDPDKHWFGSPEKMEKDGIQDDCMFSLAWCIYGGREISANDFRERRSEHYFGTMVREHIPLGTW